MDSRCHPNVLGKLSKCLGILHACFFLAGLSKRAMVKEKLPLETILWFPDTKNDFEAKGPCNP